MIPLKQQHLHHGTRDSVVNITIVSADIKYVQTVNNLMNNNDTVQYAK